MDIVDDEEVAGKFGYTNANGNIEYVEIYDLECKWLDFVSCSGLPMSMVYTEDIPKLIKALQAAYDYANNKENT